VTTRTAAARFPRHVDHDVTQLTGHAVRPHHQPPSGDDGTADTGRHRDVQEVTAAGRRTEDRLAQRCHVRVPFDHAGQPERILYVLPKWHPVEAGPHVRWIDHQSGPRIQGARCRDGHCARAALVVGHRIAPLAESRAQRGDGGQHDGFSPRLQRCGHSQAARELTISVYHRRTGKRPAEIQRKDGLCGTELRSALGDRWQD